MDNDREQIGEGEVSLVVSKEILDVGTQTRVSGRVRLRKQIVVETVTQTVELRREELVVEQMDTDPDHPSTADPTVGRPPFDDSDLELVLFAEEVVVTKRVVPVERVRLTTRTVTEQVEVTDTLRREHVDGVTESAFD